MTKVYTPDAWFSIFQNPTIYIDDDGLIYSEEEYYKTFRQASGKIDYDSGFIYGEDYHRVSRQPIGQIKTRHDGVKMIYGPDYYAMMAQPILYIRDNRIYEADQFFKSFPMEAGYIQTDSAPVSASTSSTNSSSRSSGGYSGGSYVSSSGGSGKVGGFIKTVLICVAIVAVLVAMAYFTLTDSEYSKPSIIMLAVGTVAALIFSKDMWITAVLIILGTTGVQMFIYDYISTSAHNPLGIGELVLSILLYPFVITLTYGAPAAALGAIVWLIKRPFYKKKKAKENAKKDAENK